MKTADFKYNGAVITGRESIGLDVYARPAIHSILLNYLQKKYGVTELSNALWFTIMGYERILSGTVKIDGHLSFELPSAHASEDALIAGYEAVMSAPEALVEGWKKMLDTLNETPMDAEIKGKTAPES